MALPDLLAAGVEQRRVAERVGDKHLGRAVAVEVGDERLALDLAHLHRPAGARAAVAVQDVDEADRGAEHDLELF